jgi:hypothetical protein
LAEMFSTFSLQKSSSQQKKGGATKLSFCNTPFFCLKTQHYLLHDLLFIVFNAHFIITSLFASLNTCITCLDDKSHVPNSSLISSGNFLLISLNEFPTDFLTYSLLSFFKFDNIAIAFKGCSLKYALLVHILNPSETALLSLADSLFNYSSITGKALS